MPLTTRLTKDRLVASKRPSMRSVPHHPSILPICSLPTNTILNRKPACSCGGSCPKCQDNQGIQAKLKISTPNDKYEQEADRVADQVMRMPGPQIQRQPLEDEDEHQTKPMSGTLQRKPEVEEDEEETLQAKANLGQSTKVSQNTHLNIQALKGSGQPLPKTERCFFESRFGRDLSNVRIHTGTKAAGTANSIDARAFAFGRNIAFGAGEYQPQSTEGKKLIAHELVHFSQQRFLALSGAEASGGNIQRKESTKKTDETAKKREPFADDMMRGMKPPEDLKKLRKRIITALKAFSLSQLHIMKKAGVRFWLAPGFPPKLEKFIIPPKLNTPAQYIKEARVIRVRAHTKTGHIRHELAHAWDHARVLKGKRLRRFDALSRKQITKEIERGTRMWSSSKRLKKMLKKYKDRLPHPVKEHTFESPVTGEKHSLTSVAEFYAEGYNVFHGHYLSSQARLLKYAPELYKLLEKEAKKNNLQIPNRKEVKKQIKLQKLP